MGSPFDAALYIVDFGGRNFDAPFRAVRCLVVAVVAVDVLRMSKMVVPILRHVLPHQLLNLVLTVKWYIVQLPECQHIHKWALCLYEGLS